MPTVPLKPKPKTEGGRQRTEDDVESRLERRVMDRMLHAEMVSDRHITHRKLRELIDRTPCACGIAE